MKNHGGILIGINQYQGFQPLVYAKQDAQALANFLVEEAGFSPASCLLLTDSSQPVDGHSTYPNRENLLSMLEDLCLTNATSGVLWCFFCGYGVSWNGEDYLMPIDGNPDDIPKTGIAMRSLYATLKSSRAEQVLVLLDINRAAGTSAGEEIGAQTAQLANELEIPTVLSCQHSQFARETAALSHGFFTAALLEGLRSGKCNTLDSLERYLSDRLPELSEQHFRPRQDPLTVVNPPAKLNQVILPETRLAAASWSTTAVPVSAATREQNALATLNRNSLQAAPVASYEPKERSPLPPTNGKAALDNGTPATPQPAPATSSQTNSLPPKASVAPTTENTGSGNSWVGKLALIVLCGGLVGVVLLLRFVLSDSAKFGEPKLANKQAPPPGDQTQATAENQLSPTPQPSPAEEKPSAAILAPAPAASPTPAPANKPSPAAVGAGSPLPVSPNSSQAKQDLALGSLQPAKASLFGQAIANARQIPKGDPLYPQAQQNIDRWGQVILDIAISRAVQGNFADAIAAAKLLPKDRPELYAQGQQLSADWQKQSEQQQANQRLLQKAQGLIRQGQASSYKKGILMAAEIKPGQPQYEQAKQLVESWSKNIWDIAQYRASRRRFTSAIEAAALVPPDTAAYPDAQKALKQWQSR